MKSFFNKYSEAIDAISSLNGNKPKGKCYKVFMFPFYFLIYLIGWAAINSISSAKKNIENKRSKSEIILGELFLLLLGSIVALFLLKLTHIQK